MSSLITGYEYDIFISYRQKDNRGEKWVSEFVDALKTELESTFKEEIGVYFDINPHDGLLETHDVDASLKEKLKCLVFIPIISRTYCDPKSFAWEHEFKAFVKQASADQLGLKVKLPNGNVASRILPVQIHELDMDDRKLVESELGGFLRGIEFIYKEPGVNKPLAADDDENKNINGTKYRIQVNKVANAIKEIIIGLKAESADPHKEKTLNQDYLEVVRRKEIKKERDKPGKLSGRRLLAGAAILTLLLITSFLIYTKIVKHSDLERLKSSDNRIPVVVMPFQNMTNDTTWNIWQDGIQNELINSLTNSEELKVRQTESFTGLLQNNGISNYASLTPSVANRISRKLDANVLIYGSIKKTAASIRINAQVIDSKLAENLKSFHIDWIADSILPAIDSLSVMIKNFLIISKLEKEVRSEYKGIASTNYPEAYRLYTYGQEAFSKLDFPGAVKFLSKAVAIDSNFIAAINQLAFAYGNQYYFDSAKKWSLKSYRKIDQISMQQKIRTYWTYSKFFETPYEGIKRLRQILEIDDQAANAYANLGWEYNDLFQYEKAIPEFEKALELFKKWGSKPFLVWNYTSLGIAYHKTGQYDKEKKLYSRAEKDFPHNPDVIYRQAILSLSERDTITANRYIQEYISLRKENSNSEAEIISDLGNLFSETGIPARAEEYYRQALELEADNALFLNNLAWFLIDKDRNLNEGMELAEKALKLSPGDFYIADTKGWGLYKLGKYKEALELLEKNWKLRPTYDHAIYLNLEAARRSVAGQRSN